jgi:16S rRNA (cytosine967-C5)-methyltransferase
MTAYDKRPGNPEWLFEHSLQGLSIDHRDRRLVFETVYGIIRRMTTLDYIIDRYVTDDNRKTDSVLRRLLRIGLYQLLYLDRIPDHAAVNETVKLAKGSQHTKNMAGVINAVMRKFIGDKKQIVLPDPQKDIVTRLAVEFSHPRWMIERWLKPLGLAKTKQLLTFNNEKPSIFLRRTVRTMSRQQFEGDVRLLCDAACGYRDLYYRLKRSILPENIHLLQQGFCTVQAPSSGWVVAVLEPQRDEHIIDLCSAPGGKTSLIAEIIGASGTVCACEVLEKRLRKVIETAERMRLKNVYPLVCDSSHPPFTGVFDKVLLDAPCSASGVLHRHPEARWIRTGEDIARLVKVQSKLLASAVSLIEDNGIIVYATCSLEPEENEQQIEQFLKNHPQFQLDTMPGTIPERYIDNSGFLRITPYDHGMDGMFAARLRCIRHTTR